MKFLVPLFGILANVYTSAAFADSPMDDIILNAAADSAAHTGYSKQNQNTDGPGMYCSWAAYNSATSSAKQAKAVSSDIDNANTTSLDPEIGVLYKTTIGNSVYYSIVFGVDGDCKVKATYKVM
jgi:hypothetical protein